LIEDRLGRHGDSDTEDAINSARSGASNPTNEELSWDDENGFPALGELLAKKTELQVTVKSACMPLYCVTMLLHQCMPLSIFLFI
jgi:hypothetical protein